MVINKIINSQIKELLYYNGKGKFDFKMIFLLEQGKILYFNSLWLYYFDSEKLINKFNFKQYSLEPVNIQNIYCFEGVGHYILLSNGNIISIHEELFDFQTPEFKYNFEIIFKKSEERYKEILKDIEESGDSDDVIDKAPKFW